LGGKWEKDPDLILPEPAPSSVSAGLVALGYQIDWGMFFSIHFRRGGLIIIGEYIGPTCGMDKQRLE
jgi:hypothetical protein